MNNERRASRAVGTIAVGTVAVALVATLAYALASISNRPWDDVEGEVLFEADRIRQGLALYVDPAKGAFDYGPIPARFYVLYPPVWSWLLARVPEGAVSAIARTFDVAAWFGLLGIIAARAAPGRRKVACLAAAFTASIFTLTLFTATARPDALALLLTGLALERSARKGRVDAAAAAAFALAPWIKPNMIALAAGAFFVSVAWPAWEAGLTARRKAWAALAVACAVAGAMAVVLHLASGGAFFLHLSRSTGQPLRLSLWLEQMQSRLPFFGIPLGFAALCGYRDRRSPGTRVALGALLAAIAWTAFCLAKIGSATNYFLEPAVASVVVLAHAPVPDFKRGRLAVVGLAFAQALWSGVASVRSAAEELFWRFPAEQRALSSARARCRAGPGDVLLGDEAGTELALDGRVVATAFQLTHLARRGLYPRTGWMQDLQRPQIVGIVMRNDLLDRPLTVVSVEHDRFGPEVRALLVERFRLVARDGEWRTYCRPEGQDGR